jgi:hypothetical protein
MIQRACFVATAIALSSTAVAQLDSDLSPRAFAGAPSSVRIDAPAKNGVVLFRIYTFDDVGRPAKVSQGSDRIGETLTVVFTHDDSGRLVDAAASFMGNPTAKTTYTYDLKNRRTGERVFLVASGRETSSLVLEYDELGRVRRELSVKARRPAEELIRDFDEDGRPIKETVRAEGTVVRTVDMGYDEQGCLVKRVITLRSGREDWTTFDRNDACKATRTLRTNAVARKMLTVTTYDVHGNVSTETRSDPENEPEEAIVTNWAYDYPSEKKEPATEAAGS